MKALVKSQEEIVLTIRRETYNQQLIQALRRQAESMRAIHAVIIHDKEQTHRRERYQAYGLGLFVGAMAFLALFVFAKALLPFPLNVTLAGLLITTLALRYWIRA